MDYSLSNFKSDSVFFSGATTRTLNIPIGSKIVMVDVSKENAGNDILVSCGGMVLHADYSQASSHTDLAFTSTTTCQASKTGGAGDFASVSVIYASAPTSSASSTIAVPENLTVSVPYLEIGSSFAFFFGVVFFWIWMFQQFKK